MTTEENRYRPQLISGMRTRLLFSLVLSLFGGGLGILVAGLTRSIGLETHIRFPLVVLFTVSLLTLYEGWRRQELLLPGLWISVLLASAVAAGLVVPVELVASLKQFRPTYMQAVVFGVYGMLAMAGLCLLEFRTRSTTATFKIVTMLLLGILLYYVVVTFVGSPYQDRTMVVLGSGFSLALFLAHVVVPRYFEDVYLYVENATNERSLAKFNNQDTGFWSMTGEQGSLTIVDGTISAYNRPDMIWIPEALVPRLATILRSEGQLRLSIHPDNPAPFRQGSVRLNGQNVRPGEPELLYNSDLITVGSVNIRVEMSGPRRSATHLSTLLVPLLISLLLGSPAIAQQRPSAAKPKATPPSSETAQPKATPPSSKKKVSAPTSKKTKEKPIFTSEIQWLRCPRSSKTPDQPVARLEVSIPQKEADKLTVADLVVLEWRATKDKDRRVVHRFVTAKTPTYKGRGFTLMGAAMRDKTLKTSGSWDLVVALDASGSMAWDTQGKQVRGAAAGRDRWSTVLAALQRQLDTAPEIQAAVLPFACWHATSDEVAHKLRFVAGKQALKRLRFTASLDRFRQSWPEATLFGVSMPPLPSARDRHTNLFATAKAMLEGMAKMDRALGRQRAFYLFTDGDDEGHKCPDGGLKPTTSAAAASQDPLGGSPKFDDPTGFDQVEEAINRACARRVQVRFYVAGASLKGQTSLVAKLKEYYPKIRCDGGCPQVCYGDQLGGTTNFEQTVQAIRVPESRLSFYFRPTAGLDSLKGSVYRLYGGKHLLARRRVVQTPGFVIGGIRRQLDDPGLIRTLCRMNKPALPVKFPLIFLIVPAVFGVASLAMVLRARGRQQQAGDD